MPILAPAPIRVRKKSIEPSVLIADRDESLLDAARRYLFLRGYEVETAMDGVDCLGKLRRTVHSVLILADDLLWGGDGILELLRKEPRLSRLPVILTSAASSVDRLIPQPPVIRHLKKPFALESLLDGVQTVTSRLC